MAEHYADFIETDLLDSVGKWPICSGYDAALWTDDKFSLTDIEGDDPLDLNFEILPIDEFSSHLPNNSMHMSMQSSSFPSSGYGYTIGNEMVKEQQPSVAAGIIPAPSLSPFPLLSSNTGNTGYHNNHEPNQVFDSFFTFAPSTLDEKGFHFVPSPSWSKLDDSDEEGEDEEAAEPTTATTTADKKRKRTRGHGSMPNPDAELIVAATDENLRRLNIDPNSKEGKQQRRRIRNRMSAQLHRERKRAYIAYLEGIVRDRESKLYQLQQCVQNIVTENNVLREKLLASSCSSSSSSSSSSPSVSIRVIGDDDADGGALTTDAEDSDSVSVTSSRPDSSAPSSPFRDADEPQSKRPATTIFRKGVTLFSFAMMFSFALFGSSPMSNNNNNGVFVATDGLPSFASLSVRDAGDHTNVAAAQHDHEHHGRVLVSAPSSTDLPASLTSEVRMLPVAVADTLPPLISSSTTTSTSAAHQQPAAAVRITTPMRTTRPPFIHLLPEEISSSSPSSSPLSSRWSSAPTLWKYEDHVAHLYPPIRLSQSPLIPPATTVHISQRHTIYDGTTTGNFAVGNETAETTTTTSEPTSTAATGAPKVTRRYLRTRAAAAPVNTSSSSPSSATSTPPPLAATPTSSKKATEESVSVSSATAAVPIPHSHLPHVHRSAKEREDEGDDGSAISKGLVTASSMLPSLAGGSQRVGATSGGDVLSMSQILLTKGRALLDPSLLLQSSASDGSGISSMDAMAANSAALSTWTAPIHHHSTVSVDSSSVHSSSSTDTSTSTARGGAGGIAGAQVLSVGAVGSVQNGDLIRADNMLVMLLPASSIRWGKVWSESSEGTTESVLHGLNSNSSTGSKTYGAFPHGSAGVEDGDDASGEQMWVEIGCSVLRAQIVRNVTLYA